MAAANIDELERYIEALENDLRLERSLHASTPIVPRVSKHPVTQREIKELGLTATQLQSETIAVNHSNKPSDRDTAAKLQLGVGETLPLPNDTHDSQNNSSEIKSAISITSKNEIKKDNPETCSNKIVKFKPSKYDGSGSWLDYLSHFEMCALVNEWSEEQKGLYLAVSLTGQAQAILGDLPKEKRQNFKELVSSLEERFAPPSQTELYRVQLKERRQKATETLPELGQAIRRLSNLAYPTAPIDVRETLAKEQFLDALVDSEMRLRIKQSRPKTLNDAIRFGS